MRNCIGIDIAKKQFDMHLLEQNKDMQLANDADGISKCVQLCREAKPELIVMEATGGYEALLPAIYKLKVLTRLIQVDTRGTKCTQAELFQLKDVLSRNRRNR
jgi:transposase